MGLCSFGGALSYLGPEVKLHAFGVGIRASGVVGCCRDLRTLVRRWIPGPRVDFQFGILMGLFVACIHSISNLITMNMDVKLGLEIAASNAIGWVLAGFVIGLVYKPLVA